MKKANRLMALIAIVGLLAVLPAGAQQGAIQENGGSNLGLLVTINRLGLTPTQMKQVHDVLTGLLNEANTLKEACASFAQEMIRFNGTQEELDASLEAFQKEQSDQAAVLQKTAQGAIDELKSILTFKQGETLINALNRFVEGRLRTIGQAAQVHAIGLLRMRIQGGEADESTVHELRERIVGRVRERIGDEEGGSGQRGGLMANRPGFEMRLREQGEQLRFQPLRAGRFGGQALGWLEQLVELLEMKLQYVE